MTQATLQQPPASAGTAGLPGMLGKGLMRMLSPGGASGLSILIYHRVLESRDPLFPNEIDSVDFERQLRLLKSAFNILPLDEAVRRSRSGTLPARAACITFDDGYADNAEVALPLLARHGVPATFFVATGFLDGGRMWNDTVIEAVRHARGEQIDASALGLGIHPIGSIAARRAAIDALIGKLKYLPMEQRLVEVGRLAALVDVPLSDRLMMRSEQVRELHRAGMGIGGHTVNHPILAKIPDALAEQEIAEGKRQLEHIIGAQVRLFAYPNGKPGADYGAAHVRMVEQLGFDGAVSTAWGASRRPDPFQLPRFTPWDRDALRYTLRLARNLRIEADVA